MKKSTHRVEVVRLNPEKHPNADSLSIQRVYGYQVVLRTEDWQDIELAAYVPPDSVVDTDRSAFSWLKGSPQFRSAIDGDTRYHRVTAMRLRGVISYGLLAGCPIGSQEGDDVSDCLGVTRYQPTILCEHATEAPEKYVKDYDVESFERYSHEIFKPGEMVFAFEKLDGVNSRYTYTYQDRMHVGSRTIWFKPEFNSTWWEILEKYPQIEKACRDNPDLVLYGEIIGYTDHKTKKRYGLKPGEIDFYLFDILRGTEFLDWSAVLNITNWYGIKTVPCVQESQLHYDFDYIKSLADGASLIPGVKHSREGIVVRPTTERRELAGRAVLKIVSGKALME